MSLTGDGDAQDAGTGLGESSSPSSTRARVRGLRDRAKKKTKRLLNVGESGNTGSDSEDDTSIFSDPAFDPNQVLDGSPPKPKASPKQGLEKALNNVMHPRQAMRSKATKTTAGKISSAHQPVITVDHDRRYLEAHNALAKAKSRASSTPALDDASEDSDLDAARDRMRAIEDERESLRTAWILGRHVDRVRAVRMPTQRPLRHDFKRPATASEQGRFEWERYLAHLAIYYSAPFTARYIDDMETPPFDIHDLTRIVERLAITSAPFQSFLLDVRNVYMWTDPWRTFRWAVLYWTLWYTEHIIGYFYAWVIYSTLRKKFSPNSVEGIRKSVRQVLDRESQAQGWVEMLQRHGRDSWIEPLLDELGPMIQLQLGDLANFLEVLINFHRHERPSKTAATLFYFSIALLFTLVADMATCVKFAWLIAGGAFFFTFPLGSRYPKYRFAVNVLRWIFWDIPTHAELAILNLQQKTVLRDAQMTEDAESTSSEGDHSGTDSEYLSCTSTSEPPGQKERRYSFAVYHSDDHKGRLIITRHGIEYQSHSRRQIHSYARLLEMQKIDVNSKKDKMAATMAAFESSSAGLRFIWDEDINNPEELDLVMAQGDREKVFNLVLGWSGQKWQALQVQRHKTEDERRSHLDRTIKRAMG